MITTNCFLCNSNKLKKVIDLGFHPLADTFLKKEQLESPEVRYPLTVVACSSCGHLMNGYIVPASARYQENEYSYDSSNSKVAIDHFEEFAKEAADFAKIGKGDLVVDMGSNVGTFLGKFRDYAKCMVTGVEPSLNISKIAENNGIATINNFFNSESVNEILKTKKAKLITGTNVYNHIEDQISLAKNIDKLLEPDGMVVFEAPYAGTLIDETSFDTIYLEHASYFFLSPVRDFWKNYGFNVARFSLNDYMGGSIRIYLSRQLPESEEVSFKISEEKKKGYFTEDTYLAFMKRVNHLKMDLMKRLYEIKANGGSIIGIGAATKGNTLMNYCGINGSIVDYVTDASPLKVGKFTPGSHIEIKDDKDIDPKKAQYGLILPWNIGKFLSAKLEHLGLEFIVPHL